MAPATLTNQKILHPQLYAYVILAVLSIKKHYIQPLNNFNNEDKLLYHGLHHPNSLRPKNSYRINKIQSRHISNHYFLDGIMDSTVCTSPTNTCTEQENEMSGFRKDQLQNLSRCIIGRVMTDTCSGLQLVQDWVGHQMFVSVFHEQQECPLELRGQASRGIECVKHTKVVLLTGTQQGEKITHFLSSLS